MDQQAILLIDNELDGILMELILLILMGDLPRRRRRRPNETSRVRWYFDCPVYSELMSHRYWNGRFVVARNVYVCDIVAALFLLLAKLSHCASGLAHRASRKKPFGGISPMAYIAKLSILKRIVFNFLQEYRKSYA